MEDATLVQRVVASLMLFLLLLAMPVTAMGDACVWQAPGGCTHLFVILEGGETTDHYMDCGDGYVYQGTGAYGGCPGVMVS